MASELGVQTIQHTNGTDALTVGSDGAVALSKVGSGEFYREGTFTPFYTSSIATDPDSSVITAYAQQVGHYERVGNLVHVFIEVQAGLSGFSWTNGENGTGNLRIGGLPFNIANLDRNFPSFTVGYYNSLTAWSAGYSHMAYGPKNTTYINMGFANSGTFSVSTTNIISGSGAQFILSGSYRTDDA